MTSGEAYEAPAIELGTHAAIHLDVVPRTYFALDVPAGSLDQVSNDLVIKGTLKPHFALEPYQEIPDLTDCAVFVDVVHDDGGYKHLDISGMVLEGLMRCRNGTFEVKDRADKDHWPSLNLFQHHLVGKGRVSYRIAPAIPYCNYLIEQFHGILEFDNEIVFNIRELGNPPMGTAVTFLPERRTGVFLNDFQMQVMIYEPEQNQSDTVPYGAEYSSRKVWFHENHLKGKLGWSRDEVKSGAAKTWYLGCHTTNEARDERGNMPVQLVYADNGEDIHKDGYIYAYDVEVSFDAARGGCLCLNRTICRDVKKPSLSEFCITEASAKGEPAEEAEVTVRMTVDGFAPGIAFPVQLMLSHARYGKLCAQPASLSAGTSGAACEVLAVFNVSQKPVVGDLVAAASKSGNGGYGGLYASMSYDPKIPVRYLFAFPEDQFMPYNEETRTIWNPYLAASACSLEAKNLLARPDLLSQEAIRNVMLEKKANHPVRTDLQRILDGESKPLSKAGKNTVPCPQNVMLSIQAALAEVQSLPANKKAPAAQLRMNKGYAHFLYTWAGGVLGNLLRDQEDKLITDESILKIIQSETLENKELQKVPLIPVLAQGLEALMEAVIECYNREQRK